MLTLVIIYWSVFIAVFVKDCTGETDNVCPFDISELFTDFKIESSTVDVFGVLDMKFLLTCDKFSLKFNILSSITRIFLELS